MTAVLCLLLLIGDPPPAADATDPGVRAALVLYHEMEFRRVAPLLNTALARASLGLDDRKLALAFLGRSHAALRQAAKAEAAFARLLALDPSFTIPRSESPFIRTALEQARAQQQTEPSEALGEVALIPLLARGAVDRRLVRALNVALAELSIERQNARIIHGAQLRARIDNPEEAFSGCERAGDYHGCLMRLAKELRVEQVVLGHVVPANRGVDVIFIVVDRAGERVLQGITVAVRSARTAHSALGERLHEIFGASPGPDVAAVEPPPAPAASVNSSTQSPSAGTVVPRYGGLALIGAGLATLGVGSYWGNRSASLRGGLERDGSVTQRQVVTRYEDANRMATRANLALAIGGLIAALGAGALGYGLLTEQAPIPPAVVIGACLSDTNCSGGSICLAGTCAPPPPPSPSEPQAGGSFRITGVVLDDADGKPIKWATVRIGEETSALTVGPSSGEFTSWPLPTGEGLIRILIEAPGYVPQELVLPRGDDGQNATVEVTLLASSIVSAGQIRGRIVSARQGKPVRATVFLPALNERFLADPRGAFAINVEPGTYDVLISAARFVTQHKRLTVDPGDVIILNVDLKAKAR